ncbi:MAG: insulinase family protein [Flavobacteriales bacterium]|nr:insulinase family protein [Flavobacteriales bacterium]
MEFFEFQLPNGIRVVHKNVDSPIAHCGFILNIGTRDENVEEQGIAHFIEHTIFKGTSKRKAYHILSRLDDVGGEINAFTTREDISIYASYLTEYYDRAIELLFDITFSSTFPEKELEKEKDVVIDEIFSYKDSPSESIFDEIDEMVFKDHAIGRNILGSPEMVKSFNKKKILEFMGETFSTSELVFSSVGKISEKKLRNIVEKYGSHIPTKSRSRERLAVSSSSYAPRYVEKKMDTYQTHAVIANRAYDANHPKVTALILLNNLLGGTGMNTRLNLNIREKYGFTYNLESFYTPYSDTGIFGIYLGTDKGSVEKTLKLVIREMRLLRDKPLGVMQLRKAKKQLIGQMAIGQESNVNSMLSFGKALLTFGKIESYESVIEKINAVSSEDIQEVAREVFNPTKLTTLIYRAK